MEGIERQQSADPSAVITSSADRMVGMDHAEVRYFTRYESIFSVDLYDLTCLTLFTAMITMVNSAYCPHKVEEYAKLTQIHAKEFMRRCL
jgi:hypothetical protein